MKTKLALMILPLILLSGCSKSPSNSSPVTLAPKPADTPDPKPGVTTTWTARDEARNLTHELELGPKGEIAYRVTRIMSFNYLKPNSQPKDKFHFPNELVLADEIDIQYMPRVESSKAIEESNGTGSDCPSSDLSLDVNCLSGHGLSLAKLLSLTPATETFTLWGLEFKCDSYGELSTKSTHGHFEKAEASYIYKSNAPQDFIVTSTQPGPYDYQLTLTPALTPTQPLFLSIATDYGYGWNSRLYALEKAPLGQIANGQPVQLQLYTLNSGTYVPLGQPQEIYLPTFKLNPEDFEGSIVVTPENAFYDAIDNAKAVVHLPFLHEGGFYPTTRDMAVVDIHTSKRDAGFNTSNTDDIQVNGLELSAKIYELGQGTLAKGYIKIKNSGYRKFDQEIVQIFSQRLPIYEPHWYMIDQSCDSSGFTSTMKIATQSPVKIRIHTYWRETAGSSKKSDDVTPWSGPSVMNEFTFAVDKDGFDAKKRYIDDSVIEYIDVHDGSVKQISNGGFKGFSCR